jgi:hypothetical protein
MLTQKQVNWVSCKMLSSVFLSVRTTKVFNYAFILLSQAIKEIQYMEKVVYSSLFFVIDLYKLIFWSLAFIKRLWLKLLSATRNDKIHEKYTHGSVVNNLLSNS